jgi:hypothetical protein
MTRNLSKLVASNGILSFDDIIRARRLFQRPFVMFWRKNQGYSRAVTCTAASGYGSAMAAPASTGEMTAFWTSRHAVPHRGRIILLPGMFFH